MKGAFLLLFVLTLVNLAASQEWTPPKDVTALNVPCWDISPSIVLDESWIYFISSRGGSDAQLDIFMSTKSDEEWAVPTNVGAPVNDSLQERSVFVTPDHERMYFSTDRPGGFGGEDIWVSEKVRGTWAAPANLGPTINGTHQERDPFVVTIGTTSYLYFVSDRPGGLGDCDLWMSVMSDGVWSDPVNVSSLNSLSRETRLVITADGKAYFGSDRSGGMGDEDIWMSPGHTGQVWETPQNVTEINSSTYDAYPTLNQTGTAMYFSSARPGGLGHKDIWRTTLDTGLEGDGGIDPRQGGNAHLSTTNSPNPFVRETMIQALLPSSAHVSLSVYDAQGRLVRVLCDGNRSSGLFTWRWDGRNSQGQSASGGVYLYRLEADRSVTLGKMVLTR